MLNKESDLNMPDEERNLNPFLYLKPTEAMMPKIEETRNAYATLHNFLLSLPRSRQTSIAITELETSAMWAIKGLVFAK